MRHVFANSSVILSGTKWSRRIFIGVLFAVLCFFTACDSGSSSADPDPVAEVSSSSGDDAIFSSSVTDKGTSSGGSSKSSSSVKPDSNGSQKKSSSSVQPNSSEGKTVSSSSNNGQNGSSSSSRYKTCTSEKEGVEAYISQEQSWCICTDGFWIPVSSSSTEPSSSSKYYDMSRLFVNDKGYSYGEFTDPRDGRVYKTIRYKVYYDYYGLDSLTFFAQNLNYGKMIPGGTQMTDSTKFCYDDDPWYCDNGFGGLYTWATVMNFPAACDSFAMGSAKCPVEYDLMKNPISAFQKNIDFVFHQGICPDGWHVMDREEWGMVMEGTVTMNGASYLGAVLWGSNQRGFSLLPAGVLQTQWVDSPEKYIRYANIDVYADHWIPGDYDGSLVRDSTASYGNTVLITQDRINRAAGTKKVNGLSIRCVQDY